MLIINVKPNKCNDVTTPIVLKWVYFNLPNRSFHGCFTAASLSSCLPLGQGTLSSSKRLFLCLSSMHLLLLLLKYLSIFFAFLAGARNQQSPSGCPPASRPRARLEHAAGQVNLRGGDGERAAACRGGERQRWNDEEAKDERN